LHWGEKDQAMIQKQDKKQEKLKKLTLRILNSAHETH